MGLKFKKAPEGLTTPSGANCGNLATVKDSHSHTSLFGWVYPKKSEGDAEIKD
jgi:hypothetical protein